MTVSAATEEAVDNLDDQENFEEHLGVEEPEDWLEANDEEPIKRLVNSYSGKPQKMRRVMHTLIPLPKSTVVRYRIDGMFAPGDTLPRQVHAQL